MTLSETIHAMTELLAKHGDKEVTAYHYNGGDSAPCDVEPEYDPIHDEIVLQPYFR